MANNKRNQQGKETCVPNKTIQYSAQPAYDSDPMRQSPYSQDEIKEILNNWLEQPKKTAQFMIDKYGLPQEATPNRLIWHNNGIWKYSLLENAEIPHSFPENHTDNLLQVVNYKVSPDNYRDLGWFDGSVVIDRTKGEMGARCAGEAMNYLALNLANDIINGTKNVSEARDFYADKSKDFSNGITCNYTNGLLFTPESDYIGYIDFEVPEPNDQNQHYKNKNKSKN